MNIAETLNNYRAAILDRTQSIVHQVHTFETHYQSKMAVLQTVLPSVVAALAELGLSVKEMGVAPTHHHGESYPIWQEGDTLNVDLRLVPTEGSKKFRFLHFQGYTAEGRGKNQQALDAKADKIEDHVKARTGFSSFSVNPYSLELQGEETSKSVLARFSV